MHSLFLNPSKVEASPGVFETEGHLFYQKIFEDLTHEEKPEPTSIIRLGSVRLRKL